MNQIEINGINTKNLKNIDVKLIKNTINLIIGPSGSGKSTLAYDSIAELGCHELYSMFADDISEPIYKISNYKNMIATVPIKQLNLNNNIHSTIGTYFAYNNSIIHIFSSILKQPESRFVLNKIDNLCDYCNGLGIVKEVDIYKAIDFNKPLSQNPFKCWNVYKDFYREIISEFCDDNNIDKNKTFFELNEEEKHKILNSVSDKKYKISYKKLNNKSSRTINFSGILSKKNMLVNHNISSKFYSDVKCAKCKGYKYNNEVNILKINGISIGDFMLMPFNKLHCVLDIFLLLTNNTKTILEINKIKTFIDKCIEFNLGHLHFHRNIPSLSGGELQRIRMVRVLNTQLSDLLIVLDEPLAGISRKERDIIFENIVKLSKKNTLLIVDHSDIFIKVAKNIIALGYSGGENGGYVIDSAKYITEQFKKRDFSPNKANDFYNICINSNIYSYSGVKIKLAKNSLNLIIGNSGVGKSTLLREYLPQFFDKYLYINQKPLNSNKFSNVSTILGIFTKTSEIYAKKFKKDKKYFSNQLGCLGACPSCNGDGFINFGREYLGLQKIQCDECSGTGFNKILNKYKINNKSIIDLWNSDLIQLKDFYKDLDKNIYNVLKNADELLIGHLKFGQNSVSLSGGENVRIKVLKHTNTSSSVVGIDEPFKGLNPEEIYKMLMFIDKLRQKNKTIIVVEHNLEIQSYFSYIVEIFNKNGVIAQSKNKNEK